MLRIALAQVNATVGDLDGNAELIVEWTRRAAARGVRVVVFPEMMLTGYPVEDLALRASFVEASIRTLHAVAARLAAEGLGEIFTAAGAEWRQAGCSMCLGMNPDQLSPGQRCASTSNRNFEGRQGKGGRTHLVSPAVAAATAVRGTLSSPVDLPAATTH